MLFILFSPLLCATSPVAGSSRFWATSGKCLVSGSLIRFPFFALTSSASESFPGWPMLFFWSCMDQWLFRNHPFNSYSHPIAHLGGAPGRNWIPQCWCNRARLSGGASPGGFHWGRRRWGGAVVQDNCETYARTQSNIHTHLRTSCLCVLYWTYRLQRLVATWLILPVVICLS